MGFYTEAARNISDYTEITPLDAPSFMIECSRMENMLFEGLIELDFAETYCNQGIISLTEADAEQASEEAVKANNNFIKNIIEKFKETIANLFKNIKEKFAEFAKKMGDKKVDQDKYIHNPVAKECNIVDIWFEDYIDECDKYFNLPMIDKFMTDTFKISSKAMTDPSFDVDGASAELMNDYYHSLEQIAYIPTSNESYKQIQASGHSPKLEPMTLGRKSSKFGNLVRELSLQGFARRIDSKFKYLNKDNYTKLLIDESDSPEVIVGKKICAKVISAIKLAAFKTECSICSTALKIAKRDYDTIKHYVKSNSAGATASSNEMAILAGIDSDIVFESIFEM